MERRLPAKSSGGVQEDRIVKRHVCQYHKQYPNAPYDGCTCEPKPELIEPAENPIDGYAEAATEALFPESE